MLRLQIFLWLRILLILLLEQLKAASKCARHGAQDFRCALIRKYNASNITSSSFKTLVAMR